MKRDRDHYQRIVREARAVVARKAKNARTPPPTPPTEADFIGAGEAASGNSVRRFGRASSKRRRAKTGRL